MYDTPVSALPPLRFQENLAKRVQEHSGGKAMLKAAEDAKCFVKEWNNKRSALEQRAELCLSFIMSEKKLALL